MLVKEIHWNLHHIVTWCMFRAFRMMILSLIKNYLARCSLMTFLTNLKSSNLCINLILVRILLIMTTWIITMNLTLTALNMICTKILVIRQRFGLLEIFVMIRQIYWWRVIDCLKSSSSSSSLMIKLIHRPGMPSNMNALIVLLIMR